MAAVTALIATGLACPPAETTPTPTGWRAPTRTWSATPIRHPSTATAASCPYTGEQVFKLFYMHGLYLMRGERWDRIVLNSVATPQQREAVMARYGYFHVSIAHDADAIRTLLSDPTTGEPLQPDAQGVYWYRDPGMPGIPAAWFALKRYGNAIAAWMAGGEQRTDEHWDRMNAELERLPPPP